MDPRVIASQQDPRWQRAFSAFIVSPTLYAAVAIWL